MVEFQRGLGPYEAGRNVAVLPIAAQNIQPGFAETAPPPGSLGERAAFPATMPGERGNSAAIVESRYLLRDCISQLLDRHLGIRIKKCSAVDELLESGAYPSLALLILGASNKSRQATLDDISRIRGHDVDCRLVVLTDGCDSGFINDALEHGAHGIITTASTADVAVEAFRLVMAGGTFIPAEGFMSVGRPTSRSNSAARTQFTVREEQIVALLRCGKPNKQIAHELGLSEGTVKVHLHNIMKKRGVSNRTQILALSS